MRTVSQGKDSGYDLVLFLVSISDIPGTGQLDIPATGISLVNINNLKLLFQLLS